MVWKNHLIAHVSCVNNYHRTQGARHCSSVCIQISVVTTLPYLMLCKTGSMNRFFEMTDQVRMCSLNQKSLAAVPPDIKRQ